MSRVRGGRFGRVLYAAAALLLLATAAGAQTLFGVGDRGPRVPQSAETRIVTHGGEEIVIHARDYDGDGRPDEISRHVGIYIFFSFRGPAYLLWLRIQNVPARVEGGREIRAGTVGEVVRDERGHFVFRPARGGAVGKDVRRQFATADSLFKELDHAGGKYRLTREKDKGVR